MREWKKFVCCICAVIVTMSCIPDIMTVYGENLMDTKTTYQDVTALSNYCFQGYNEGKKGPITIVPATLQQGWWKTKVYLIGLSGTETVDNQATGFVTDLLAGFEQDNRYLRAVVSAIEKNVPKRSKLVFCGHSLGGMVAQQCAANETLKKDYTIKNTITFGSPLIRGFEREGSVKRLGDTSDKIPYYSVSTLNGGILWQYAGLNREDGQYGGMENWLTAHIESYTREEVWGDYDVLGQKNGKATITFDNSKTIYCKAPVLFF